MIKGNCMYLVALLIFVLFVWNTVEGFGINMSTRFTRNQSYDLRGDPFPLFRAVNPYLSPWGMSSWIY